MQELASVQPLRGEAEPLERLHPNARLNWILGNLIGVGILTVIGSIVEFILLRSVRDWPWPTMLPLISLVGGAVLAIFSAVMAMLRFSRFGFRLRERDLVVQSGVIWRTRRCVPRSRIQHVDLQTGPINRALGLVNVYVYVAGGMGAVAEIPGVSPQVAEEVREALIVARTDGV